MDDSDAGRTPPPSQSYIRSFIQAALHPLAGPVTGVWAGECVGPGGGWNMLVRLLGSGVFHHLRNFTSKCKGQLEPH